jgi:hypothetical protein
LGEWLPTWSCQWINNWHHWYRQSMIQSGVNWPFHLVKWLVSFVATSEAIPKKRREDKFVTGNIWWQQQSIFISSTIYWRGTYLFRSYCFMLDLLHFLSTNYPNRSFHFPMDNLNIYKHLVVLQLIHHHGHRIVFRASYCYVMGQ